MSRKQYLMKEIFCWTVLVLLIPETGNAQVHSSHGFKKAFQEAGVVEPFAVYAKWVVMPYLDKGLHSLNEIDQGRIDGMELFSNYKGVNSLMSLSIFVPVCKNKKKAKMKVKGESMKVGNRRLWKIKLWSNCIDHSALEVGS